MHVLGRRDRTYAMPMLAMVANIYWEFLVIVGMFRRFWRSDFPEVLKPHMWLLLLGCTAFSVAPRVGIVQQFGKAYGSAYTAYGANLMMSALFLALYVWLLIRAPWRRASS